MSKEETVLFHIHDGSLLKSVISDAMTFITVVSIIGVGVVLESAAMQWVGFLMLCLILMVRTSSFNKKKMTAQQAADFLRDKYGVVASNKDAA